MRLSIRNIDVNNKRDTSDKVYRTKRCILIEKNYITSGRNTVIHKVRKIDLIIVNGSHKVVIVSHRGIGVYEGPIPRKNQKLKKPIKKLLT